MAKKDIVDKIKEGKAYGMTVAEQYKVLKESHKIKPDPDAFTENFEEKLRERLFLDGVEEIKQKEKDKIENPDFERSGYTPKVEKRSGIWDYSKEDEIEFFGLRNEIFHIINNEKNFQSIVNELLNKFSIEFPKKSVYEWVDIYTQLEILDDDWMTLLSKLKSSEITQITLSNSLNNELKNLLIYFIYRHLSESIYDGKFNGRLLFAILSCYMISTLTITNHKIEDIARMYSSEIEYSDENLSSLIDLLQIENLEE